MGSVILTLEEFSLEVEQKPYLADYASQLRMLRDRIAMKVADRVIWAAAFGSFLNASQPRSRRTTSRLMEVLVVTTETSPFKAHMLLADEVFGPTLAEFKKLPEYHVWTVLEFQDAMSQRDALVRRLLSRCVTIYGAPIATSAVA